MQIRHFNLNVKDLTKFVFILKHTHMSKLKTDMYTVNTKLILHVTPHWGGEKEKASNFAQCNVLKAVQSGGRGRE